MTQRLKKCNRAQNNEMKIRQEYYYKKTEKKISITVMINHLTKKTVSIRNYALQNGTFFIRTP